MSHAAIITAVIQAAAALHSQPVDPMTLMDSRDAFRDQYLRGRLNAVIAWHLHHNHKIPIHTVCRAYRVEWTTIDSRIKNGRKLIRKSPWKQTYLKLP